MSKKMLIDYRWESLTLFAAVCIALVLTFAGSSKSVTGGMLEVEASKDTKLQQSDPTTNFASDTTCAVDGDAPNSTGQDKKCVMEFDVSSIPTDADIYAAVLTLDTSTSAQVAQVHTLDKEFVESEATWNQASNGVAWDTAGAKGAGDISGPVGEVGPVENDSIDFPTDLDPAIVEDWVDNPGNNHGVLVEMDAATSDDLGVLMRENTNSSHPSLLVFYDEAPTDPTDTTAPNTSITGGTADGGTQTANDLSYTFSSDDSGMFYCNLTRTSDSALAGGEPCVSGAEQFINVPDGTYRFDVVAEDDGYNLDATAASRTVTINVNDANRPDTTITGGPSGSIAPSTPYTATFNFSGSNGAVSYECRLLNSADVTAGVQDSFMTDWESCVSGQQYSGLYAGDYEFQVRAINSTNQQDPNPAIRAFSITGETHADIEGESLSRPADSTTLTVFSNANASGGQVMRFNGTNDVAGSSIDNPNESTVVIRAKGAQDGSGVFPKMQLLVDGEPHGSEITLTSTGLTNYTVDETLPVGPYELSIDSSNDASNRSLQVDKLEFKGQ